MSSTNRGIDRHISDYYVTPQQCIKDFLTTWRADEEIDTTTGYFDPCAGGDTAHAMSYPTVLANDFGIYTDTMDIREDSLADEKVDYLTTDVQHRKYKVIITNPPFFLAKEIIEKALADVADNGYVVMLLRLNFFGSQARKQFLQENMPERVYVHSKRIGFTDDGKTDSIEYMHAVWRKGYTPDFTKLKII